VYTDSVYLCLHEPEHAFAFELVYVRM